MAALIDEARRQRAQAQRLRGRSVELRAHSEAGIRLAHERVDVGARAYARRRRLRAQTRYSAWSDLPWLPADEQLASVLEPLPPLR